jgi:hypothetical protein
MHLLIPILIASTCTLVFLVLWNTWGHLRRAARDTARDLRLLRDTAHGLRSLARSEYPLWNRAESADAAGFRFHHQSAARIVRGFNADGGGGWTIGANVHGLMEPDIHTVHGAFTESAEAKRLRALRSACIRRLANRALTLVFTAIILTLLAAHWPAVLATLFS